MTWTIIAVNKKGTIPFVVFHGSNSPKRAYEEAKELLEKSYRNYSLLGLIPGNHRIYQFPDYEKLQILMSETSEKILIENN